MRRLEYASTTRRAKGSTVVLFGTGERVFSISRIPMRQVTGLDLGHVSSSVWVRSWETAPQWFSIAAWQCAL